MGGEAVAGAVLAALLLAVLCYAVSAVVVALWEVVKCILRSLGWRGKVQRSKGERRWPT